MEGIELHVALTEAAHLAGARLGRVHQIGDVLLLRTFGPSGGLALDPRGKAFHLTGLRPATPTNPPSFCQLVRKLRGQPLVALEQAGYDRVLRLRFPQADLLLDLRPRRGELFLQWREGRTDALHGSEPRPASFNEGGLLSQGIGPELRRAAEAAALPAEEFARKLLERGAAGYLYETPRGLLASFFRRDDLGEPVEETPTFGEALDRTLERRLVDPAAHWLRDRLRVARERRQRALRGLEEGRVQAERWPEIQSRADLILARLSDIPHGTSEATVQGFDETPVRVPLDPRVPPVVHAQALYRQARKLRRRLEHLPRRRKTLERELRKLDTLATTLSDRPDLAPYLEEELASLGEEKTQRGRTSPQPSRSPPREILIQGYPVHVGRSAKENDVLVRRARDEDLWLHARGVPGAHVLVPAKGREVPPAVLQRAAELAAWHSHARGERKVQVSYTEGRYLRKPKGASPGAVVLLQENVLWVRGDRGP